MPKSRHTLLLTSLLVTAACSGDFGATPGGVQDMGFARELIDAGRIPPPEAFTVEGMYSEHDLPLEGEPCETLLCLRGALGLAPTLDGEASAWLQVGLSSTIDPQTFSRDDIALIAAIDVSCSMGWNYGEDSETPGKVTRELMRRVAAEMGANDRVAIVTYGSSVDTKLGFTPGDQQSKIQGVIDDLTDDGSTNMEAGLKRAFELARSLQGDAQQIRVMLFTDAQPNVGATDSSEFSRMVADAADDGIGITIIGAGLGLGQELVNEMAHLRGGNAFSLFDTEGVGELMADSWPWMVSPIAYDMKLEIEAPGDYRVADTYGFPGSAEEAVQAKLEVASVFLSRRRGALLVRLTNGDLAYDGLDVAGRLTYVTRDGATVEDHIQVKNDGATLDERGQWYAQTSVGRSVALAVLVGAMKSSAELYAANDQPAAVRLMDKALQRFEGDAAGDDTLAPEVTLSKKYLELLRASAPQGSLYDR